MTLANNQRFQARAISGSEVEAHYRIMCEAFALDRDRARSIYFRDPFFDLRAKRVLFDRQEPVSCLTVVPITLRLHDGATLEVGGVAGVGTPPSLRGRGYAGQLLAETIRDVPEELGVSLLGLMTDRPDFYRRLGWEVCSDVVRWSIPRRSLPRSGAGDDVAEVAGEEYEARRADLQRLVDESTAGIAGTFVRSENRWRCLEIFCPDRRIAVWPATGAPRAYAAYQIEPAGTERAIEVHEIVSRDHAGTAALIGYLAGYPGIATVAGRESRTRLAKLGLDGLAGLGRAHEDGIMLRLVGDPAAAVREIVCRRLLESPELGAIAANFTLRVSDPALCTESTFRLAGNSDPVPRGLGGLWISGPVGAITQMVTGYRSPAELAGAGAIRTSGAEALTAAEALFPQTDLFLPSPDIF